MRLPSRLIFTAATLSILLIGCTGAPTTPARPVETTPKTGPIDVRVASFPAEYLAKRVGGAVVQVQNVLPAGKDPPFWSPTGDVVATIQKAELIVANGAGFEKWMQTANLSEDKVVDSAAGIDFIHLEGETHSHGKGGEHSHAGIDPHTWSDPLAYYQQAEAVHAALVRARPDRQAELDANLAALKADLDTLHRELTDATAPGMSIELAANHPAFNYLARRYGLRIHSFDFDPEDRLPTDHRAAFDAWAEGRERPLHLLWESPPTDAVRRALPAGILHITIDPLEQPPERGSYDYLAQARQNVTTFRTIFSKSSSAPPATPEEGTP